VHCFSHTNECSQVERVNDIALERKNVYGIMVIFMAKYRVEIDHTVCHGFGACVELCSKFDLSDEDGKSHVEGAKKVSNGEAVELDELGCHKQAAEACPFNAIHIINLETDEKLI